MTTLNSLIWALLLGPLLVGAYAYCVYPALLWLVAGGRETDHDRHGWDEWPSVSICLPAYNEEDVIRGTLEALCSIDYPADRLQILVVSDGSTDGTNDIVREFETRGVTLLALDDRGGKTAAENAAIPHLHGDIVVNTDATTRIDPDAVKALVRRLADPGVGVASGRDVSVAPEDGTAAEGEKGYVDFEMWLRSLETRVHSIVGASGCLYAIRRELHATEWPAGLSRDFGAALLARERGYRAVSAEDAIARVPLTPSLWTEFRRKRRTILRGLRTLFYKRHLLNPFEYGHFAAMLFSHKLCRWIVPLLAPVSLAALAVLAFRHSWAAVALIGSGIVAGLAVWLLRRDGSSARLPRPLGLIGFGVAANIAAWLAWMAFFQGESQAIWEPTRRTQGG